MFAQLLNYEGFFFKKSQIKACVKITYNKVNTSLSAAL